MSLVEILEDHGQVRILDQVKSIAEARKTLGLTEEEFNDYINYKNDKQFYEDIIKNLKVGEKMGGQDREQILESEFLGRWRAAREDAVEDALAARDRAREANRSHPLAPAFDMQQRFAEATRTRRWLVEEAIHGPSLRGFKLDRYDTRRYPVW